MYKCADHLFGVRMISCENHSIVWAENGFMDLIFWIAPESIKNMGIVDDFASLISLHHFIMLLSNQRHTIFHHKLLMPVKKKTIIFVVRLQNDRDWPEVDEAGLISLSDPREVTNRFPSANINRKWGKKWQCETKVTLYIGTYNEKFMTLK